VVSGYGLGGMMNTSNMHGNLLTGVKGPFSLTQWAELEQQALIYKYITANVPVPSSLLLSLKKSFFPYGSLPPNSCKFSSLSFVFKDLRLLINSFDSFYLQYISQELTLYYLF